jgi:replicative DNA helicase
VADRVVELPSQPGRQGSAGAAEFERTPPQDVAAEQSVLGGMLLSKDAIADVVEVVRATDFYRPAHQTIFDVVVDLYGKGEPADPITVSAELTRLGEIGRVGGAPYLHTLLSSVPTAANAGFYARIVAERAVLRRLVEAGTRIVQLGYGAGGAGDVDDIVDRAQQSIYDVTERRSSEDYILLEELMQPTMDELEAIGSRGGGMSGVPTGFADLDSLTNGLHPGQLVVIAGRPGLGKALALETPLPTPTGWTTMGQVVVGDQLLGADGRPTTVVAATEVMTGRPCFEVVFSDGTTVIADAEHQWLTTTRSARRGGFGSAASVRTTAEIAATVRSRTGDRRANHAVALTSPLDLPEATLPLPPYVLGVWLGDGHAAGARFTTADPDIAMYVEAHGVDVVPQSGQIPGDGCIPAAYLRGSERQRRDLLAGLLDTDGTVSPDGSVQFTVTLQRLAEQTRELIVSLGYRCATTTRRVKGRSPLTSTAFTLTFTTADAVFQLPRKALLHKQRCKGGGRARARFVTDVHPVTSVPVRCVEVDNTDHLYLATRAMVPTHNSTLGLDIARSASVKNGQASCIFSLEMSKTEITMRLLSAEARVPLHHMRAGTMTDDDWARLARRMGEVAEAPLYIDDSPNLTMMEIRAKARRLRQRHDLKLVVIDYLQLMTGNKKAESRQQEVSELSRNLKLLAKELDVPVVAMSQLNRGAEQRTDKKPQLSDLRESGCLPATTRVLRADTGGEVTLGELFASGATDVPVWSLDDSLRYVRRHLTHVFATGRRPVFRLRLASGHEVTATANHPFLTPAGWRPLGELSTGDRVAVPRHVPAPLLQAQWSDEQVLTHAAQTASSGWQSRESAQTIAHLPKRQLRLFLRRLWQQAGHVSPTGSGQPPVLLSGEQVLADVSRLLLRFGISVLRDRVPGDRGSLAIVENADCVRFWSEIALATPQEEPFGRPGPVDTVPDQVWERVRQALVQREPVGVGRAGTLRQVADALDEAGLDLAATNDVAWEAVVAVEPLGEQDVYDATVLGTHNFVADGIAVHNSIEQDADMVILLHREDAYEKESPRAGEADFIVAKHRNGPTSTITVAFQGHYSRFVDMNPG